MKIRFYLRFYTHMGQSLELQGNIAALGGDRPERTLPMEYLNQEFWQASIDVDPAGDTEIRYRYNLLLQDGQRIIDGEKDRIISLSKVPFDELHVIDTWNDEGDYHNAFFTVPFQNTLLAGLHGSGKGKQLKSYNHIFKVKAPLLKKNEVVCMTGSGPALGDWSKDQATLLTREGNWWVARLQLPQEVFPVQYKYGIYNTKTQEFSGLETYENRYLHGNASDTSLTIVHDGFARLTENTWKGAGTAIPVFSLRSKNSFGVGEFTDLILLVDWARSVGLKLVQILPINDTSATHTSADSYPYAAISAFALHPIYINLEKVAGRKNASIIKALKKKHKTLNEGPRLDYEEVMRLKLSALKEIYYAQKEDIINDTEFYAFFQSNKHWLVPYAAFCHLRDKYGTADFSKWKTNSVYDQRTIEKFTAPKSKQYDSILLQYFIQYHLHLQLKEAIEYAHKKGIVVKGDIPIGIYRHSADAWTNPTLYNMNMQAGAPPDPFADKGQNWGFPTYNWKKMQEDGYAWQRLRFEQMSVYFDAFRIDHILGFFRIWSIPVNAVEGIMGVFEPAIPIHINEFEERRIWFDKDRYTKPFIDEDVITTIFGEAAEAVKEQCLVRNESRWELKEEFDTQRKVEAYFSTEQPVDTDKIRTGLYDLISNVILFEMPDSNGSKYHFRINMESTLSFKYLSADTQRKLRDLYVNYFFVRQDDFWKKEAMAKLPALKRFTNMLICGEDLGMVPHSVPEVMKQLGILSLEIQRMPKDANREFFHPNDAPYLSVITPSTHDMSTIRGWWEEDRDKTQRFFNHELGQWGEAPVTCEPWINKAIVLQHLYSPAMWSIFQLQDLLGMSETLRHSAVDEERINIPADPKHYWCYRMHLTLEQLIKEKEFNEALKGYLQASGR